MAPPYTPLRSPRFPLATNTAFSLYNVFPRLLLRLFLFLERVSRTVSFWADGTRGSLSRVYLIFGAIHLFVSFLSWRLQPKSHFATSRNFLNTCKLILNTYLHGSKWGVFPLWGGFLKGTTPKPGLYFLKLKILLSMLVFTGSILSVFVPNNIYTIPYIPKIGPQGHFIVRDINCSWSQIFDSYTIWRKNVSSKRLEQFSASPMLFPRRQVVPYSFMFRIHSAIAIYRYINQYIDLLIYIILI